MIKIKLASGIILLALIALAVACATPQPESDTQDPLSTQNTPTPESGLPNQTEPADPRLTPDESEETDNPTEDPNMPEEIPGLTPTGEEPPAVTGQVPENILNPIIADFVERTGADPSEIEVVRSQSIVWNDGSLGCAKPSQYYTQIPVNGYWVILTYQGQRFDYRVNERGAFFLCEAQKGPDTGLPGSGGAVNPAR